MIPIPRFIKMNTQLLLYCLVLILLRISKLMGQAVARCDLERHCNNQKDVDGFVKDAPIIAFSPANVMCTCTLEMCTGAISWEFNANPPDGQDEPIDTSSPDYEVVSETHLRVLNATGRDSGVYSCIYADQPSMASRTTCIIVIGKARFADCADMDSMGNCLQDTQISAEAGRLITFNTHITFAGDPGTCANQTIDRVRFFKVLEDDTLYECMGADCSELNDRIQSSGKPGKDNFDLTLNNTTTNDSGMYRMTVRVVQAESPTLLTRTFSMDFSVNITDPPVITTEEPTTTPDETTTEDLTGTAMTEENTGGGNAVEIAVPVVILAIIVPIIIIIVVVLVRYFIFKPSAKNGLGERVKYRHQNSQASPLTRDEVDGRYENVPRPHPTTSGDDSKRASTATGDVDLQLDEGLNSEHTRVNLRGVEDNGV